MNLQLFQQLNAAEQEQALWEHGVFLDERQVQHFKVLLYQMASFYVEVYYDKTISEVTRLKSFTSTTLLQPYLDKIDVTGILS